jgi:hypothetical protein
MMEVALTVFDTRVCHCVATRDSGRRIDPSAFHEE